MKDRQKIAEILLEIGAVSLNPTTPYKYASGILSPIYTDCRLLASHPAQRKTIIDALVEHKMRAGIEPDVVVGTGSSAISLATHLAQRLALPMAYVRARAKNHGMREQIEGGGLERGCKALLVSDIMSTERDIPTSVRALHGKGATVVYCITIFSNNLGIIEGFLQKEEIPFHSLTDLKNLLRVASTKERISPAERASVEEWMANPADWDALRRQRLAEAVEDANRGVAEVLLKTTAVTISSDEPYRYASGILSPVYTNNRLLMSHPKQWEYVISCLLDQVVNRIGVQNVDVIAGVATSGIAHAAYLADKLSLPMAYVKSQAEDYGKRTKIEGVVNRGDRVVLLEDLVTTGGSAISAATTLREAGARVEWCLAIFTYGLAASRVAFSNANIKLLALSDLDTLLAVGREIGQIEARTAKLIAEWSRNPKSWTQRFRGSPDAQGQRPRSER